MSKVYVDIKSLRDPSYRKGIAAQIRNLTEQYGTALRTEQEDMAEALNAEITRVRALLAAYYCGASDGVGDVTYGAGMHPEFNDAQKKAYDVGFDVGTQY